MEPPKIAAVLVTSERLLLGTQKFLVPKKKKNNGKATWTSQSCRSGQLFRSVWTNEYISRTLFMPSSTIKMTIHPLDFVRFKSRPVVHLKKPKRQNAFNRRARA